MANIYDITIIRGDSYSLGVRITDTNGNVDLTGATIAAQIRLTSDSPILASFDIDPDDLPAGHFFIELEPAVTALLDFQRNDTAKYDVQVTHLDGTVNTRLKGNVTLDLDITQ